jgi:hypothetical protein
MKPFNLERAKAGDPVITRDGLKVRILCFDRKWFGEDTILGLASKNEELELPAIWNLSGESIDGSGDNLFMAPVKKEGWINIWIDRRRITGSQGPFETEEIAKEIGRKGNYCTVKVEWEE